MTLLFLLVLGNWFLYSMAVVLRNRETLFIKRNVTFPTADIIDLGLGDSVTNLLIDILAFFFVLVVTLLFIVSVALLLRNVLTLLLRQGINLWNLNSVTLLPGNIINLVLINSVAGAVIVHVTFLDVFSCSKRNLNSVAHLPWLIPTLLVVNSVASRYPTKGELHKGTKK